MGSGDLVSVIGNYRPDYRIQGWVKFYSGKISPGRIVRSRISRVLLSKSPRNIGAIELEMDGWE